jgi:all-trans-retinol 13,14-reductase
MSRFTATWITKTQISPTTYEVLLQTADLLSQYKPGQYINLELKPNEYRSYSIAGIGREKDYTTIILIIEIPEFTLGLSHFFIEQSPPQIINCIGPVGRFTLTPSSRRKVFVATGTGIAPIIPMIHKLLVDTGDIELIYGIKSIEYNYLNKYLDSDTITNHICTSNISPEQITSSIFQGRVTEYFKTHASQFTNCDFYLCGNPNMIAEMKLQIEQTNGENTIYTENFFTTVPKSNIK